jgi:hypothetical protein
VSRIWQIVADLLLHQLGMDEQLYQEMIKAATVDARQQFYVRSPKVRQLIDELERALNKTYSSHEEAESG